MAKVAIVLGVCLAVGCFGAFGWQQSEKNSREDEAAHHREVATTLDGAAADGLDAGVLLLQYVGNGDETLVPQMLAKTEAAESKLAAASETMGGDANGLAAEVSSIIARSNEVIALRQAGQVEEAGAALLELSEEFTAFVTTQQDFIADERAAARAASARADDAGQLATWFLVAGMGALLIACGGAGISLARRSQAGPLPA